MSTGLPLGMTDQNNPTTAQLIEKATELGNLIAQHAATSSYREVNEALNSDVDAQRLLSDYNRHLQTIAEKEAAQKPIEIEDKKRLNDLQGKLATDPILSKMQIAQMDYLDLMRHIETAMATAASEKPAG